MLCRHIENEASCSLTVPSGEIFVNIPIQDHGFKSLRVLRAFLGFVQSLHRTHISTDLVDSTQHQNVLIKIIF